MAQYKVTSPEGKQYVINGPAGASREQVLEVLKYKLGETERPDRTLGEAVTAGASRGYERLKSAAFDVLPAMVASKLGFEDYAKRQMEEAAQVERDIAKFNPPSFQSYKDITGPTSALGYAAETVGESAPDILASLIPGGVGGTIARRVGTAGLRELGAVGAEQIARRGAIGEAAGVYLGSYAQNAPEVFQSIYNETGQMEPGVAALFGAASAGLDSILPASILRSMSAPVKLSITEKILERSGMDPSLLRKVIAQAPANVARESLTESGQEMINIQAEDFVRQTERLWDSKEWNRIIEAGIRGGIAGGVYGTPGSIAERVRERASEPGQLSEKIAEEEQRLAAEIPPPEAVPPAPSLDRADLLQAGLKPQSVYLRQLAGKDLSIAEDAAQVEATLAKMRLNAKMDPEVLASVESVVEAFKPQAVEETTAPKQPALTTIPYETVQFAGEGQPLQRSSGQADIIDYGGRKIVMREVNGVLVPFYLSTGLGGKKDAASGKWYPFFGIGADGWINKTSGKEMADYYGSKALRQAAEELDSTVGDIRQDENIPKVGATGAHIDFINQNLTPAENSKANTLTQVRENIDNVIAQLEPTTVEQTEEAPQQQTPPTPSLFSVSPLVNADPTERGLARDAVEDVVQTIKRTWTNAPQHVTVQSVRDLPKELAEQAERDGVNPRGVYDPDSQVVYLVADNIPNQAQAAITLAHEALGHFGLRVVLGKNFNKMMDDLYRTNKMVRQRADEKIKEGDDKRTAVEEVLADMAQEVYDTRVPENKNKISALQKVMNAVKQFLRRLGVPVGDITDKEVLGLIANARKAVVSGPVRAAMPAKEQARYTGDTRTPEFRKWFGKSKVVDEDGEPKQLYHSTYSDIKAPTTNFGADEYRRFGMHVGSLDAATNRLDVKAAEDVRQREASGTAGANILPVYVKAESPLRLDENRTGRWGVDDIMRQIMEKAERGELEGLTDEDVDAWYNDAFDIENWLGLTPEVGSREYDPDREERFWSDTESYFPGERSKLLNAFIKQLGYDSIVYRNEFEGGGDSYLLLDPNQIKSVFNKRPTESSKILYSKRSSTIFNGLNQQVNNLPGMNSQLAEDFKNSMSNLPDKIRSAALGFLTMPQIEEVYGTQLPSLKKLTRALEARASDMMDRRQHISKNITDWYKIANKHKALLPRFFAIANRTTLDQVDVLDQAEANNPLTKEFKKLPQELQDVYRQLRNEYKKSSDEYMSMLLSNLKQSKASEIRLKMEAKRMKVYLPLFRMGDYWVSYNDQNGERVSMAFESTREAKQAAEKARDDGMSDVKEFARLQQITYRTAPPTGFMGSVVKQLEDQGVKPEVIDSIYQTYLSLFPAQSVRQQFRKREGRLGFREDVFQVYANMATRMANQLANMKNAEPLESAVTGVRQEFEQNPTMELRDVVDNMQKQLDFIRNPVNGDLVNKASYFSYMWFIAGNVSSALVNLTQMPIVVYPLLGGRYGFGRAADAMQKATAQYWKGGKDNNSEFLPDWTFGAKATGELKQLYDVAVQRQAIRRSTGYEITEARKAKVEDFTGRRAQVEHGLGWIFQNSERANREITLLAAFNLAREGVGGKPGMSVDNAIEYALSVVNDAHGASLAEIGPRYFQQGIGKVAFTFKRFAQAQIYLLGRLFHQAFKGADKDTRDIARKQLLGIAGTSYLFAGIQGMPLYGAVSLLANMLADDDDEPFDMDATVRAAFGDIGYKGPVNALLSVDIASRTGFNGLLWRDDPKRLAEIGPTLYAIEQAAGPAYGAFRNAERGLKLVQEGEWQRGMEALTPSFVRNGLKAFRLGTEGAMTKDGVPITDDIGAYNTFMQIFGFNPAELAEAQARAGAEKRAERAIMDRRSALLEKAFMARQEGDSGGLQDIMEAIGNFNEKNPEIAITAKTLRSSQMSRQRRIAESVDGVYLNPKIRARLMETYGGGED
jgi:hypothetical protein